MSDGERDLEKTLQKLHEEGIIGGVETVAGDGMQVWIGDDTRRIETGRIEPVITAGGRRWIPMPPPAGWPRRRRGSFPAVASRRNTGSPA